MFTVPTTKEDLEQIANGKITEKALPLSNFWEKRIISALGFSEKETKELKHNLRENRKGTTDAERECKFYADGKNEVRAKVTFRIGKINPLASETFIVTIRAVIDATFMTAKDTEFERVEGQIVEEEEAQMEGMKNTPAIRTVSMHTGICKYCGQTSTIEAPDNLSGEEYNRLATEECDCNEAIFQRNRKAKMEAAGAWAKSAFSQENGQLQLALCAIKATYDGAVESVVTKIGKKTYKIDKDKDGMIRIKATYKNTDIETF